MARCDFCGDELVDGLKTFGICSWCVKDASDKQKRIEEYDSPGYFIDNEEYKGEVDFG